jgi:hypothetical protein
MKVYWYYKSNFTLELSIPRWGDHGLENRRSKLKDWLMILILSWAMYCTLWRTHYWTILRDFAYVMDLSIHLLNVQVYSQHRHSTVGMLSLVPSGVLSFLYFHLYFYSSCFSSFFFLYNIRSQTLLVMRSMNAAHNRLVFLRLRC